MMQVNTAQVSFGSSALSNANIQEELVSQPVLGMHGGDLLKIIKENPKITRETLDQYIFHQLKRFPLKDMIEQGLIKATDAAGKLVGSHIIGDDTHLELTPAGEKHLDKFLATKPV